MISHGPQRNRIFQLGPIRRTKKKNPGVWAEQLAHGFSDFGTTLAINPENRHQPEIVEAASFSEGSEGPLPGLHEREVLPGRVLQ